MRGSSLFRIAFLATLVALWQAPAHAQDAGPTPKQLQTMIANGHEGEALRALKTTLRAHPHSGVAWYLVAEAEDASNNLPAGRSALAKAEQYAPGLPFAQPDRVAALRAHLNASGSQAVRRAAPVHQSGISPAFYVIGGMVILFILVRLFLRSRRRVGPPGYPNNYGGGFPGGPGGAPYGNPNPYGPGGATFGRGSGIGGSILGGLAAGAGFAAGERIIDGLGNRGEQSADQGFGNDPIAPPDRDDGLSGSPDWSGDQGGFDDGGGGFDPDDKW